MPRVTQRKARKDYPNQGIKKGDTYYYTSLKTHGGGIVKRSLKPFKPSQLTNSPYKSGYLAAQESWEDGDKNGEAMRSVAEALREIGSECQDNFDNMPEGLQQGDTGQMLENRASECEGKADDLDGLADELEALEDPGEYDDTNHDPDDSADVEAFDDWQAAVDEKQSEEGRIIDEADSLIGDMPE